MARKRTVPARQLERRDTPKKEKSILANYDEWVDSLLERIGIRPKLVVGMDEFLTVLITLFYAVLFFFKIVEPFALHETQIPVVPELVSSNAQTNITGFFEDLKSANEKYSQCFSLVSVHSMSYREVNLEDQLSVYNGHFTPAHTYVFNDYVYLLNTSDAIPRILVAISTEQSPRTEESLRVMLAAAVDALCSSRLELHGESLGVVLAVGRTYASIEHAFLETYGRDVLSSVLILRLKSGVGWSGLQLTDLFSVKDGETYRLPTASLRKGKSFKYGSLSYLYEWFLTTIERRKFVALKDIIKHESQAQSAPYGSADNRKAVVTLATIGGFRGADVIVPSESRWKRNDGAADPFDAALIGSVANNLSGYIADALYSLLKGAILKDGLNGSNMRPLLFVTGRYIYVPRAAIPIISVVTLFVLLYTMKKYRHGSKKVLLQRLLMGVFSRLLIVSLAISAGYIFVVFYPELNKDSNALNFVTGAHRALLSTIVLFIAGASVLVWGAFPLASIPVSILESSLFLILVQPILLVISSSIPGIDSIALQFLQISLFACCSQLLSDSLRKRFKLKYPSLIYGITITGAIILTFPTIYYNIYLLLNSITHSKPIWSLTDEAVQNILISIIAVSSVVLTFAFGHVGALMRRAPMRFLIGIFSLAVSFVPMYYYCNRPSNEHLIKNMKHVPGTLSLPRYNAHIDVTFWCFDNEKACSVDVYNGLYDSMELYDTVSEDDEQSHKIQFFSQNVNITIPALESHSITCSSGSCTSTGPADIVVISNTVNKRYRYNSQLASVENITGMISFVCERVPMQIEESVYWRRTYKAYNCYRP